MGMDGLIVSLVTKHLSGRDLALFAQVNVATYTYCKNTNTLFKPCQKKHHTHHCIPSILEDAKLMHCLKVLDDVLYLAKQKIPLSDYCTTIVLRKICGTKITISIGRVLIINYLIFAFGDFDALCELQSTVTRPCTQVLCIDKCRERLQHKVNSIINHTYIDVKVAHIDKKDEGVNLRGMDNFVKVLCSCKINEHQPKRAVV